MSVLDSIGNTPLVELRHMSPKGGARIVMKLESANPTGSMKDRMARAMVVRAEEDGRLAPGREIVEFTGGSTGTSLAFVCAAKGYPLSIVTSDAFSIEKRNHMKAFGAMMTIEPSQGGMVTPDLFVRMRAATEKIVAARNAYWTKQFENHDQTTGYYALADEAWQQTGGRIDAFVHAVGTCGSLRGTVTALRKLQSQQPGPTALKVYAVEPSTSAVMSGGAPGAHRMEGMGTGRLVPMWDPSLADGIETVSTEEPESMARRLAKEEAIFAGTSTGSNVVAAIRVASQMRPDTTVLTIAVDSGLKYVSTELYR
jgi:cysteine synthase A